MKNQNWQKCLLCGDSKDIIKRIPDNSVDFILTDPPYNIGRHSTGNIHLPWRTLINNDVAEWDWVDFNPEEWADEFVRILKPTGNLFIFTSYNQLGRWYNCLDHIFDTSNFMIWHKTNPPPKIFKAGFLNSCEMIFVCWNKKHTWNFISQKDMHNFIESLICMRPERISDPKHPAQKPVSILKKLIEIASNKDDIVFDPFMGVGSTGVAALNMNRKFIGIELNNKYFEAAKKRINAMTLDNQEENNMANEPQINYQTKLFTLNDIFPQGEFNNVLFSHQKPTGLQPIIKWAGGKEKELKYILPNIPAFNRYFEPFVGGGAVFFSIQANEFFINDLSDELIALYKNIASTDKLFFYYADTINKSWQNARNFFINNPILIDIYLDYRKNILSKEQLKTKIYSFCDSKTHEILNIVGTVFENKPNIILEEMSKNLFRKMLRMHELELKKQLLPDADLNDNIETAIKSAVYMNYRHLYNDNMLKTNDEKLHCALFLFIRNYSYSGMFRYNDDGCFNVPYGGIAYNSKTLTKKLNYYQSTPLLKHFKYTGIYNLDFETFLRNNNPDKDDFVFLDPPYDSIFNTYAQNEFTRTDQERLANYMINECKAKWMMVIKNTDFIYNLYNRNGINIRTFDKEYLVSFMNRNDKKVTHLLITNY
jgi:site-specific DNA-adenine methylase